MKLKIAIPDAVSAAAAELFSKAQICVLQKPGIDIHECSLISKDADAVVVRSYSLLELELSESLKAVGRAGAGVNNIPVDRCTEKGVVVFNTPGANANAVKELVLCGLLLSSRKIIDGVNWTGTIKDTENDALKLVEKNKKLFKGTEIKGKNLGILGLGAIGMLIANDASALGMNVSGYDPFISVDRAWQLSRSVKKAQDLNSLLASSDYISLHIPLNETTTGMINKELFSKMKRGIKIMNFSRGELVNSSDLVDAINIGIVDKYVTDFPSNELIGVNGVICIPHLGASTAEAEENCALMAADQIIEFLQNGNITNSVNFPDCSLERNGGTRIIIINKNIPAMIERIAAIIAEEDINIKGMINKSREDIAYNIVDISGEISKESLKKIQDIEGVIRARIV